MLVKGKIASNIIDAQHIQYFSPSVIQKRLIVDNETEFNNQIILKLHKNKMYFITS